jgi:peptidoglycan/LPS O-acetylase OafA/YrhL
MAAATEAGAPPRPGTYLPTLDGWRAVAVAAVVLSHSQVALLGAHGGAGPLSFTLSWMRLGVDLFFAISGFLITYRLMEERASTGRVWRRSFYPGRSFRILPPAFLYLGAVSVLGVLGVWPTKVWEVLASLLFVRNYTMHLPGGEITNHFWSLSVEEHFYLVWPFLFLFVAARRRALWIVPAIALGVHVWRSLDARLLLAANLFPHAGLLHRTDTRLDSLLWGCLAALVFSRLRNAAFFRRTGVVYALLAALVGVVAAGAPMLPLWTALLFPLIVVSTVAQPESILARWLERPALAWVGRMSYGIYLWQTLFLQCAPLTDRLWGRVLGGSPLLAWCAALGAILLCAVLSHHLVERPCIALGRRLAARHSRPPPARGAEPPGISAAPEPAAFATRG